ncbi:MAG: hypothetical protein F4X97_08030 [Boseongicola sp. SB0662_bin_57]|nr:hypothetical protein [Boseongicola sp. SB0662_bin_57]
MPRLTNPVPVATWRPADLGTMLRSAMKVRLPAVATGPVAGDARSVPGVLRAANRLMAAVMVLPCRQAVRGNVGTRGAPE